MTPEPPLSNAGERWGWELRTGAAAGAREPFGEAPPGPDVVGTGWARRLAATRDRVAQLPAHLVGWLAVTALFCVGAFMSSQIPELPGDVNRWFPVGFIVLASLTALIAVRPLVLPARADARYRRWLRRSLKAQGRAVERTREWERRRSQHDYEQDAQTGSDHWAPLGPTGRRRVDVFGGDPEGNAALLTSLAPSLIDAGSRVSVLDLSQDGIAHRLVHGTAGRGRPVATTLVPDQLAVATLFDGFDSEDVGVIVAEAIHAADPSERGGGDKTLDATLIEQICGCLTGPVTFARLFAAFRIVTEQLDDHPLLGEREQFALRTRLGESAREATRPRLFRLAAALQRLASVEVAEPDFRDDPAASLRVWELSERVGDLAGELLAQLLYGVFVQRLKTTAPESDQPVWVILGADRIGRGQLERIDQLARRRGVRLILFFRHLRDAAVEVLGGSEAAIFMRLGNAKEAEHAATFIGKEHRLIASQFTASKSASWSSTVSSSTNRSESEQQSSTKGSQQSRSRNVVHTAFMDFPHRSGNRGSGTQESRTLGSSVSVTSGTGTSEQTGGSQSDSVSYQRVYEYAVEPTTLQGLSATAFVLVDPADPGSPRLGDCAAELGTEAGAGDQRAAIGRSPARSGSLEPPPTAAGAIAPANAFGQPRLDREHPTRVPDLPVPPRNPAERRRPPSE